MAVSCLFDNSITPSSHPFWENWASGGSVGGLRHGVTERGKAGRSCEVVAGWRMGSFLYFCLKSSSRVPSGLVEPPQRLWGCDSSSKFYKPASPLPPRCLSACNYLCHRLLPGFVLRDALALVPGGCWVTLRFTDAYRDCWIVCYHLKGQYC